MKNTTIYRHRIPKNQVVFLYYFDICTFRDGVCGKMKKFSEIFSDQKSIKRDQYFSFPVTELLQFFRQTFPWLCYSLWEDGAFCLQCVLFGAYLVKS